MQLTDIRGIAEVEERDSAPAPLRRRRHHQAAVKHHDQVVMVCVRGAPVQERAVLEQVHASSATDGPALPANRPARLPPARSKSPRRTPPVRTWTLGDRRRFTRDFGSPRAAAAGRTRRPLDARTAEVDPAPPAESTTPELPSAHPARAATRDPCRAASRRHPSRPVNDHHGGHAETDAQSRSSATARTVANRQWLHPSA